MSTIFFKELVNVAQMIKFSYNARWAKLTEVGAVAGSVTLMYVFPLRALAGEYSFLHAGLAH